MNCFIVLLVLLLNAQAFTAAQEPRLNLNQVADWFFEGDPFNTWQKPEDPRYKDPNKADEDARKVDLTALFQDPEAEAMRKSLFELQEKYKNIYQSIEGKPGADFILLSKEFTDELIAWTAQYIDKAMPPSVSRENFAFIGFGSMARKESGPITDLESALVWDENYLNKEERDKLSFTFARNVSQSLQRLMGHPSFGRKGYRTDESGAFPLNLAPWARLYDLPEAFCAVQKALKQKNDNEEIQEFREQFYYPFEGSWAYATTPKALAEYTRYPWIKHEDRDDFVRKTVDAKLLTKPFIKTSLIDQKCIAATENADGLAARIYDLAWSKENDVVTFFRIMGRNRVFLAGNQQLFDDFDKHRNDILNESAHGGSTKKRHDLAMKLLSRLVSEFESEIYGDHMFVTGILPESFDLKRNIYRFDEQIFTNLGLYYNLKSQNIGDIIKVLAKTGLIGSKLMEESCDRVNELARLRWKGQLKLNSQQPPAMDFSTEEAHHKKITELNNELITLKAKAAKSTADSIEKVSATLAVSELESKISMLEKLAPLKPDSVLNEADIALLKDKIMPAQARMFRRVLAFTGYFNTKLNQEVPPNDKAFLDDFDVDSVHAKIMDVVINKKSNK